MTSRPLVASFGYHDITDVATESGFQRPGALPYKLTVRSFREHLDRIAAAGQMPALVTTIDLTRPGRHLMLTFDDGGRSALAAADELSRRGWKGHFFITTGMIGHRTFLSSAEIRKLRDAGHLIGSHSHTHPDIYRDLSLDQMIVEWRRSSDILAQITGEPCLAAAVPGGDISPLVLRSAGLSRLRFLFTSEPSLTPGIVNGCWVLGRYCVKSSTTPEEVGQLASLQGWTKKLLVRRLKGLARRGIPSLYRLYVRRSTRSPQEQTQ